MMQLGRFAEAEDYVRRALEENAKSDVAFYNYGLILRSLGRPAEAAEQLSSALAINPGVPETWNNRGVMFNDLKRYREAITDFDKALSINANYPDALCNKGNALAGLRVYDQALAAYDKALALNPALVEAWIGRGNVGNELKWYTEALAAYDKAMAIKGDVADAWLGRGNVYTKLRRYNDALAAYDKALSLRPDLAETWLGRGNVYTELKQHNDALACYDKTLTLKPDLAEAWLGRGNLFYSFNRYDEAEASYDKALVLNPYLAGAWVGRGNVFYDLFRYDEAEVAYDKARALKPDLAEAWAGRGNLFAKLRRYDDAVGAYDTALALDPDLKYVRGDRLHAKQAICDWTAFDAETAHLLLAVREEKSVSAPFALLSIVSSPADQLRCAQLFVADKYSAMPPLWRGDRFDHDRIRVAYLSGDFREHPMSFLAAGMFECHDKSRFETTAISWGPDDKSAIRDRIRKSVERFIDVRTQGPAKIAALIRDLEIDIVVDLMGFTTDSRTSVFAARPAPIQINYLGYLGTMGAPYIDYIIADRILIPTEQYACYSENIVCLPNTFQVNDRERRIADRIFMRAEMGLPEDGFVFCCFNNNYKITPDVFDIWMRILKRVEGSVLWLVGGGPTMERNLRSEAAARIVDPQRLVFAQRLPLPEHQARLRLADLFLDTLPYNAGTTASDALWAGLPVLARMGDTMAGRMAASVLYAIGLPELIATTPDAYEQMAIELATQPEKIAAIKRKVVENRLSTPLFDTKLFTKHIEAAYIAMHERYQAGLPPTHLYIPD
jgi:protein O-GlcNAc transferase